MLSGDLLDAIGWGFLRILLRSLLKSCDRGVLVYDWPLSRSFSRLIDCILLPNGRNAQIHICKYLNFGKSGSQIPNAKFKILKKCENWKYAFFGHPCLQRKEFIILKECNNKMKTRKHTYIELLLLLRYIHFSDKKASDEYSLLFCPYQNRFSLRYVREMCPILLGMYKNL